MRFSDSFSVFAEVTPKVPRPYLLGIKPTLRVTYLPTWCVYKTLILWC